jgi:ABC-type branched-subunit amino acid transport system ATPase component
MILRLENVQFTFPGKIHLLHHISFVLEQGKIYALMGANGSGKTTLFNLLTGFLKPHSGKIFYNNIDITGKPPYKINLSSVGRIFQDLRLINDLTVTENITLAMKHNPTEKLFASMLPLSLYKEQLDCINQKAKSILERFFLSEVSSNKADSISYGQQKLLSLACCIANDANLLLLDEPVAGINQNYREKITHILKKLKAEGKTIFLIEHNTDFIEEVSDEIFFLDEGKIKEYDSLAHLKSDASVLEAYM